MIARTWRGATAASKADEYVKYLLETGVSAYRSTQGNRGVLLLRRIDGDRAEFLLVSLWESMDDVRRFAGEDPERAVFYPEDDAYLLDRDLHAAHYEAITVP